MALTLNALLEIHAEATPEMLQPGVDPTGHRRAMTEILSLLGADSPAGGRAALRTFMSKIGLHPSLDQAASRPIDVEALAAVVNTERLGNNPVVLNHWDLVQVLRSVR